MKFTAKSIAILLFITLSFQAQARKAYYPKVFLDNLKSQKTLDRDLKNQIKDIVQNFHYRGRDGHDKISSFCPGNRKCTKHVSSFSYKEARIFLFGKLHLKKSSRGYYVKDRYCENKYTKVDGIGPGRIPKSNKINCEHTWPQSKFSRTESKHTQKVDLHHLFPVAMRANSTRSNHPFAEVNGRIVNANCDESHIGKAHSTSTTAFEPPNDHKGDTARAIFYFASRYGMTIDPLQEGYLRTWHFEDPVDQEERKRNDAVEDFQQNRNPFVDYPMLVGMIHNF